MSGLILPGNHHASVPSHYSSIRFPARGKFGLLDILQGNWWQASHTKNKGVWEEVWGNVWMCIKVGNIPIPTIVRDQEFSVCLNATKEVVPESSICLNAAKEVILKVPVCATKVNPKLPIYVPSSWPQRPIKAPSSWLRRPINVLSSWPWRQAYNCLSFWLINSAEISQSVSRHSRRSSSRCQHFRWSQTSKASQHSRRQQTSPHSSRSQASRHSRWSQASLSEGYFFCSALSSCSASSTLTHLVMVSSPFHSPVGPALVRGCIFWEGTNPVASFATIFSQQHLYFRTTFSISPPSVQLHSLRNHLHMLLIILIFSSAWKHTPQAQSLSGFIYRRTTSLYNLEKDSVTCSLFPMLISVVPWLFLRIFTCCTHQLLLQLRRVLSDHHHHHPHL